MLEREPPVPHDVTAFGDEVFEEATAVKGACSSGPVPT